MNGNHDRTGYCPWCYNVILNLGRFAAESLFAVSRLEMAGLLSGLLAKSVVETNGIFWAWFIHFLQDVVIFSAFVMAAANKSLGRTRGADVPLAR